MNIQEETPTDGSIEKYKTKLVAKNYTHKKCTDYFDTHAFVSRITTIRTLLALASIHNLIIHQMYVKTVFLNGELKEEIYMDQPDEFTFRGQERKVCRLVISLYGLKQALRYWHENFDKLILDYSFAVNKFDKCLYSKIVDKDHVMLCLYVDDILIFGTSLDIIIDVKGCLSNYFDMKGLGEAETILGMKICRNYKGNF